MASEQEQVQLVFFIEFEADFEELLRHAKFEWNVDDYDFEKVYGNEWYFDYNNWIEEHEQQYWEDAKPLLIKAPFDNNGAAIKASAKKRAKQAFKAYVEYLDLDYFKRQLATFKPKFNNDEFAHAVRALVTPLLHSDDAIRKSKFFQSHLGGVYDHAYDEIFDNIEEQGFNSEYYLKTGSAEEVAQIWVDNNQDAILEAWEDAKEDVPLDKEDFAEAMEQHIAKIFLQNITANGQNTVTARENGFDHRAEAHQLVATNIDRWHDQLKDMYRGQDIPQVYSDEILDQFYSQSTFEADNDVVDRMADAVEGAQLRNGSNPDVLKEFEQGFASGTLQLLLTELENHRLAVSDFVAYEGQMAEQVISAYVDSRFPGMFQAGSTFNGIEEVSANAQHYGAETAKMYFGDFRDAVGLEELFVNAKQQQIEFPEADFADGVQEEVSNEFAFSDEDITMLQDFFKQELASEVKAAYADAKSALATGDSVSWMHPDSLDRTVTDWAGDHWNSIGDRWVDFKHNQEG